MKEHSFKFIIEESKVNFHSWALIADGFTSFKVKEVIGDFIDEALMKFENDTGQWGVDIDKWNRLGELTIKKLSQKELDIDQLIERHHEFGQKLFNLCDVLDGWNLQKKSGEEFARALTQLWSNTIQLNMIGIFPVLSDFEHNFLTNKLADILLSCDVKPEELQEKLSILVSMNRETLYWREELELLELAKKYNDLKKIKDSSQLKEHIEKYFWLNFGYVGPVWTERDFIDRIRKFLQGPESVANKYKKQKEKLNKLRDRQDQLERELGLSEREKVFFSAAREFMYAKAYRMEVRHRVNYVIEKIFAELAKRLYVPVQVLRYTTRDECLNIISAGKVKQPEGFLSRREEMLYVTEQGNSRFIEKDKIDEFLQKYLKEKEEVSGDEVQGQVAFSGKAKGVVSIIRSPKDNGKIEEGGILVAKSTNPDVLPAMNKAAAFVTDVGGITSHAAIVAREMEKPCVIGTKYATQVFKDGDMVEVDAEKGVVRKVAR